MAEEKPTVVDWEQNNFGIRTSHTSQDFLNTVNIDANAPQIKRRKNPSRHKSSRKQHKPPINRNSLRNYQKLYRQEKNYTQKSVNEQNLGRSRNLKNKISSSKKDKGFGPSRVNPRINPRLVGVGESLIASGTTKSIRSSLVIKPVVKVNLKEKLASSPKSLHHNNFLKYRLKGCPKTSKPIASKKNKIKNRATHRATALKDSSPPILQVKCKFR